MDMLVRYSRQSKFYLRYRASERAVCLQIKVVVWPKIVLLRICASYFVMLTIYIYS